MTKRVKRFYLKEAAYEMEISYKTLLRLIKKELIKTELRGLRKVVTETEIDRYQSGSLKR